jgi:RNA recognition motif-containing protein
MAKRLFVGSLSYDVTQDQLEELFAGVGKVESATLITDKFSGNSKGFGFVEMSSDEESKKAIDELNGKEVAGRNIVVNEARPREERPGGDRGGFNRGGGGFRDRGAPRRRY